MNTAKTHFNIPLILTPEDMSSSELDDQSSITYISYYIKEGSPGYKTTLKWVQEQLSDEKITNFSVI